MKIRFPAAFGLLLVLAGCDSRPPAPAADPLAAERQKLEADRAALETEKARLAQEQLGAQQAAADAETRRLRDERGRLETDQKSLKEAARKLELERAAQTAAGKAAAREAEERREREALKAKAEEQRREGERLARETREREAEGGQRGPRTVAFFYDALASHGEWLESEAHGYVWRPTRAKFQPEWRPYADGRWQWTEYGWTWQSHEPYGWAVFHYGRWFRSSRLGWLWVPGAEWAPAWVAWRVKGSEYVGWAPLPPESRDAREIDASVDQRFNVGPWSYAFLPVVDFDQTTYVHKFVPKERQLEVLRGSRNVTQLAFHKTPQGSVVTSGGPDSGRIGSAIRELRNEPEAKPVPRINLVFSADADAQKTGDVVEAGAMMLFAPKLEKAPSGSKPAGLREKNARREIDHGWGDPAFEAEWRSVVQKEASAASAPARPPVKKEPPAARAPEPAPTPEPVRRPPPERRPNPLNPSRLQPSGPLIPR